MLFFPLGIQTPAEVRHLDPQNIPEIHPHELFGCLGFLMRSVLCLEFVFLRKSCRCSVGNSMIWLVALGFES